jgi:Tfp pilus assembly protein PilZ
VPDAVTLARTARESLSRALGALQGDPNVPPHLLELAAPIAQAMGALHQIERSSGAQLGQHVTVALASLQAALAQLQAQSFQHPAVAAALESVAGALATVHALSRAAAAFAPPPQPSQQTPPVAQPHSPGGPAYPAQTVPHPQAHAAQPPPAQPNFQRAGTTPQAAATAPQAAVQPLRAGGAGKQAAPPSAADMMAVIAELGAHSPSNFYKGLSGNDIIDHGGLFVATYKIPRIGNPVRLKVSMPGGYEFEANAIVRWRREASDAGNDAPPGFGAQFTEITPEARQLVYRYVRNREPLFHDDF